jgi:tetratricopeptide (TPR) repeat protein
MSKLFRSFCCLLLIGFLISPKLIANPSLPLSSQATHLQQAAAREVQDLLFHRRYEQARLKVADFIQRWPEDITGYFGMMILFQLKNFENFDHRFDEQYLLWHKRGRKRAVKILKDARADPWHLFIASGTLAVSGLYRINQRQTLRAIRDGAMAINAMKNTLEKDPNWVDPRYGLAMYDYWRSVFTNRWTFLPFFPDRREKGIRNIKKVVEEGTFSKELAQGSLAYMYYNEEKYEDALKFTQPLVKKYPSNIILRLLQGHILAKLRRYDQALRHYRWVQKTDPAMTKVNFYVARLYFEAAKVRQEALKKQSTKEPIVVKDYEKGCQGKVSFGPQERLLVVSSQKTPKIDQ